MEWVKDNKEELINDKLIVTSSTAELISSILELGKEPFGHGSQGGDILLAERILEDQVHGANFFRSTYLP